MLRIKLLSAFQVLTMPDGAMGASHERARAVICEVLGLEELPVWAPVKQESLEDYLSGSAWSWRRRVQRAPARPRAVE